MLLKSIKSLRAETCSSQNVNYRLKCKSIHPVKMISLLKLTFFSVPQRESGFLFMFFVSLVILNGRGGDGKAANQPCPRKHARRVPSPAAREQRAAFCHWDSARDLNVSLCLFLSPFCSLWLLWMERMYRNLFEFHLRFMGKWSLKSTDWLYRWSFLKVTCGKSVKV